MIGQEIELVTSLVLGLGPACCFQPAGRERFAFIANRQEPHRGRTDCAGHAFADARVVDSSGRDQFRGMHRIASRQHGVD